MTGPGGEAPTESDGISQQVASQSGSVLEEHADKLLLEVGGQYRVGYGPTDDRKVPGPRADRDGASEAIGEALEALADEVAVLDVGPARSLLAERLPVLVTGVVVTDLGRVDDEGQRGGDR